MKTCLKSFICITIFLFYWLFLSTSTLAQLESNNSTTLQQTIVASCIKKRPRCTNGKRAVCTNKSFKPKCLPEGIADCCKKITKLGLERGLECKPELLKCPT